MKNTLKWVIKYFMKRLEIGDVENDTQELAYKETIDLLEELNKYREIGTAEECQTGIEKQEPKRPIGIEMCVCPKCDTYNEIIKRRRNTVFDDLVYCWHCGQPIKVSRRDIK